MEIPDSVTVGVVLYAPQPLEPGDLEREATHAATIASQLGVPRSATIGQAIARTLPDETWRIVLARQQLAATTDLLASVHFFKGRPEPLFVASALAVFAQAWLHRRVHGTDPPAELTLHDIPNGPLSSAATLREAANLVNTVMIDDKRYGAWMEDFQKTWRRTEQAD